MSWESLTDGFFKGSQFHTAIPSKDKKFGAISQKTESERRLQVIRSPGKDGGGVNDFGRNQDVITVEVIFFGTGYLEKFNSFKKLCNDGLPGILVVPIREKALVAYFQKSSDEVSVGNGGTIKATFTFLEDTTVDPIDLSPVGPAVIGNTAEKTSALANAVSNAKKILNNNPLVQAVRLAEGGLSTARRYAGVVLAMDASIRARIVSVTDNIKGTLDLVGDAVEIFRKPKESSSSSSGANTKNVIDPDTGQEVVPFDQDDSIVPLEDPLEAPLVTTIDVENTPEISGNNLNSNAGVEVFSKKVAELIKEQRSEMTLNAGGRVDDVSRSLTHVIVALDDFRLSIAKKQGSPVVVPSNFSVMEIMFHNGIPLDRLDDVIRDNYHIDDVLMVPSGTVVYL